MARIGNKIVIAAVLTSVILLTFVLSNSVVAQTSQKTVNIYPIVNDPAPPLPLPPLLNKYSLKCYNTLGVVITCPAGTSKAGALAVAGDRMMTATIRNNDHIVVDFEKDKLPKGATGITLETHKVDRKISTNPTKSSASFAKGGDGGTTPVIIDLPKTGFSLSNSFITYIQPWLTFPFGGGQWTEPIVNSWVGPDGKKLRAGGAHNTDSKEAETDQIFLKAKFTEAIPDISITSVLPTSGAPGDDFNLSGAATNQYSTDKARINWGDGTEEVGISFTTPGAFSATHSYTTGGTYDVVAQLITFYSPGVPTIRDTSNTVTINVKSNTELRNLTIIPTSVKWGHQTTASAILWNTDTNLPAVGQTVTFSGSALAKTYTAITNSFGVATVLVTTASHAGTGQLVASYTGSSLFFAAPPILPINVTLLQHNVSITLGIDGTLVEATTAVARGAVTDNDDSSNQVNGVTVQIGDTGSIGFPDPQTAGVRVADGGSGLSIASGVLTVNPNTRFDIPFSPTDVKFTFNGISLAGVIDMEVTYNNPAILGATVTSPVSIDVPVGNPIRGVSLGSGIVSVKFVSFPGSTLGFSNIETRHNGNLMQDVGFSGPSNTWDSSITYAEGAQVLYLGKIYTSLANDNIDFQPNLNPTKWASVITAGGGAFASSATLGSQGIVQITAQSQESDDYEASGIATLDITIAGDTGGSSGVGNNVAISTTALKLFAPYNCGDTTGTFADDDTDSGTNPDNDGDYLCDRWEGAGIPFTINDYAPGSALPSETVSLPLGATTNPSPTNNKDVWVEEDYFTPHRLRDDSVSAVTTAFLNRGIYLHVIPGDSITEAASTNVWTDTDNIYLNDFTTIKARYFGLPAERATLNFVTSGGSAAADATVGAPSACTASTSGSRTVTITGIQISTVANAYDNDVSGRVIIPFRLTMPTTFTGTVTPSSVSVTGTGTGVSIGPLTTTNVAVDITTSSYIKTITITVPFSVTGVVTNANLGTVSVTLTLSTCSDPTTAVTLGGVSVFTSMQDAKAKAYHYLLSIHSIGPCVSGGTASGRSEPSNDMVVSLGCGAWGTSSGHTVGTKNEQAGTLMHEIGHNLGLNHGGPITFTVAEPGFSTGSPSGTTNGENCKPNQASVMSYSRQVPGYLTDPEFVSGGTWLLDYSYGNLPNIRESALYEFENSPYGSVSGSPTIVWQNSGGTPATPTDVFDGGTINWNGGTITASPDIVSVNTNNFGIYNCNAGTTSSSLFYSLDDWSNLNYNLRALIGGYYDGHIVSAVYPNTTPEMNSLVLEQITIQSAVMFGFIPPPSLLGDEIRNRLAATPFKFALYKSDGVTLITYGEGFAVVTKKIESCSLPNDCVEPFGGEIGPFLFGTTHHSFSWNVNQPAGTYYFDLFMRLPESTEVVPLADLTNLGHEPGDDDFDLTHPILRDANLKIVDMIVTYD